MHLILFLKGKLRYFFVVFQIYVVILLVIFILFLLMCFKLKGGKLEILWPIYILKYCLPIICYTFFGQLFLLLISVFECKDGKMYYDENIACKSGKWFYYSAPISIIAMIIQIILSYLTISTYYEADFVVEGNDLLKKRSSKPDIIFLLCKIIIIIIFVFDKQKEYEHWGILFTLCLITGFNAYCNLYLQNYDNSIIKKLHLFFSLFLFWGFFCLFISNIFKRWEFGGGFHLFVLGIILIFLYCLFYVKTYIQFLHLNFNDMNTCQDYINYIKAYLKIIMEKKIFRDSSMILTSFIEKMEDRCINNNCILKKYLESLSKGFDSNFLLLQYAQKLFKIALKKYPDDITLRLHYIIFLIAKTNQKKNAEKELFSIKSNYFFISDNFNLYRCKKYIEEYNSINIKKQGEEIESTDLFHLMEYKNDAKEFKKLLSKSSSLYYDFWTTLYNSHLQGAEDFKKLNDIGAELNKLIEDIEKIFEKLQKIKNNDLEIIKLYESYVKNILNDKKKYEKYYNMSINLIRDNKIENMEMDYTNYDLKILNENDEYKFLVVSANEENKGTIINISLNACLIFGYHKHDIVGKHMNILIPELYHKIHDKIFNEMCEKTKTEFFENLSNRKLYKPKFIEFSAFVKNKSKYLIPLEFKLFFVQTDEGELVYVIEFSNKKTPNTKINEENDNNKAQLCYVLTNNNLIIQTFTSNCVELLGLSSNIINSNYDITSFIKQFNDELQFIISNSNKEYYTEISENKSIDSFRDYNYSSITNDKDKVFQHKLKLKKKLLKLQYSHPRKITWKKTIEKSFDNYQTKKRKSQVSLFSSKINKDNIIQKNFLMEVKEAHILEKHIGYYFIFKKLKTLNETNIKNIETIKPGLRASLRKSNVKKYSIDDESIKSNRTYNMKEENKTFVNNFRKLSVHSKKRNSMSNELNIKKLDVSKKVNFDDEAEFINYKYIPNCNINFFLNLKTMHYKPTTKMESCKESYDILKNQSIEKMNMIYKVIKKDKKKKSSSSSSSSDNTSQMNNNSSDNNSSSSPYSSNSKSSKNANKNKNIQNKGDIFNNKNINNNNNLNKNNPNNHKSNYNFYNDYYKVNINEIRFMIYDFHNEMIIDDKNEIKSQMEINIEYYKSKQNINISEDINYANISFERYTTIQKDNKNSDIKNSEKNIIKAKTENFFDKGKEFEKEIKYALLRKDEQKSIISFYKISFIFLVIVLLMGLYEIYFINNHYSKLQENVKLVINSANLKYYNNYGIYFMRENILNIIKNNITNGIYNVPDTDHNIYKNKIINIAKSIFIECNSILETIIKSNLNFYEDTQYYLNEMPFDIEILYNNNSNIRNLTSTFFTSLIHIFSSLCNVLVKFECISIDDPNLYNFFHNSFNNLGNALTKQIQLFISELILRQSNLIIYVIIIVLIYLILHIILFFIIYRSYCSIIKNKESYISVFYEIGLSLIKTYIKKCEIFINKINQNDENTKYKNNDVETSCLNFSSNIQFNNIIDNKQQKKLKKNRKLEDDKNSKYFKIIYVISLIISFFYLIIVLYSFLRLTSKFITSGKYIFNLQNYHNNIIELFNTYREYLFDENNIKSGIPAYQYLIQKQDTFFSSSTENLIFLISNNNEIRLSSNYIEFQKSGFCNSYISYFNNKEECEEFLGGEEGFINLGFFVIVSSFIEDIRNGKNYMKQLLDKKILVGNLSNLIDINSNDTTFGLDKNDTLKFRMFVFNSEKIHTRVNILFVNIIIQYINQERNITMKGIESFVVNGYKKYLFLVITYMLVFVVIFFFYWIPKINNMNVEIYTTKKMLSIIPPKILSSLPNIKKLLNISKSND